MPSPIKTAPLTLTTLTLLCSVALSPSAWALGPSAWEKQALDYQADIAKYEPMTRGNFLHTHNSYNNQSDGYIDPSHGYSVTEQLDSGVRYLELDTWLSWHPVFGVVVLDDIVLSHGAVGPGDTPLADTLYDIDAWLDAGHDDEVILIRFEDHILADSYPYNTWFESTRQAAYQMAVDAINDELGGRVFTPAAKCDYVNTEVLQVYSKDDIIAAGKNIILFGDANIGCNSSTVGDWGNWVHTGNADISKPYNSTASYGDAVPCDYDNDGVSDAAAIDSEFYRFYNDYASKSETISATQIANLVGCGINAPGPEPFGGLENWPFDDVDFTYSSLIWSWHTNEPNNSGGNENCAEDWSNGRMNDLPCDTVRKFACRDKNTLAWALTSTSGSWWHGPAECAYLGANYEFGVPVNGYYANTLKTAKGTERVWVNYSDWQTEGDWEPMSALVDLPTTHWSFDDGSGSTASNRVTSEDAATLYGNASFSSTVAPIGLTDPYALSFDGSDDYATIPDSDAVDFARTQDFTVAVWIKADSTQPYTTYVDNSVVEKWSGSGGYPYVIRYVNQTHATNSGKLVVARYNGSTSAGMTSNATIDDGQFHHVAYVKSGSTLYLYIDGFLDNSRSDLTSGTTTNSSKLYLGQRGNGKNDFKGAIDDLRIYDHALSYDAITALAQEL